MSLVDGLNEVKLCRGDARGFCTVYLVGISFRFNWGAGGCYGTVVFREVFGLVV